MKTSATLKTAICLCLLISRVFSIQDEGFFTYLKAEKNLIESIKLSQKAGGFTLLPFTLNNEDLGDLIHHDLAALRQQLLNGSEADGLAERVVATLTLNQSGYLYACLAAATSGRELELIKVLEKHGFTADADSNTIALYGIYIVYNGAREKKLLLEPIRKLIETFKQAKQPIIPIGRFGDITETLLWAIDQPIPISPLSDQ